jgi:predicted metal-dependent hydrolase
MKAPLSAQTENGRVQFGETLIEYRLQRGERKTLAIHVYPNGSVVVDAPLTANDEAIAAKVKKRASWIVKQQRQFTSYPPEQPQRRYVSGESVRYLGRQYRLRVNQAGIEQVKLQYGHLNVDVLEPSNSENVKSLVHAWLRSRADAVFTERYAVCLALVEKLRIEPLQPGFQLRLMPTRWGSCTQSGKILLNPELIAAPKECIDYVIAHELCHLKERNHSQTFYKLLASVMKDWEDRKTKLNQLVEVRFL